MDGETNATATMLVIDVSAGGCFVATRDPVAEVGAVIRIIATLTGVELPLVGRVVHVKPGRGFAIEFGDLPTDTRYMLDQFLIRTRTPQY